MNDKADREIMQMALEALYSAPLDHNSIKSRFFERRHHAIIALRERLAQPEQWGMDVLGGDWNKFALAAAAILKETK